MLRDREMKGDGEGDDPQGPKVHISSWPTPCRGRKEGAVAVAFSLLRDKDFMAIEEAEWWSPVLV